MGPPIGLAGAGYLPAVVPPECPAFFLTGPRAASEAPVRSTVGFWYRDPAAGDVDGDGVSEGFNLSNAVGIAFGL